MSGPNQSNPNPYFDVNWKQFEQFFGGKLPFASSQAANPGDLSWIDGYIKEVLQKSMPRAEVQQLKHHYHTELFETHKSVIAKIHVPDKAEARKIRVLVNMSVLRLDGLPDNRSQTLRLPSLVMPGTCKAVYKNGILQLHMRKQTSENPFYEIDIRFN
ncbi:Hsp20/alpha crystallin family protein [Paenibacillus sp. YYML68]|uniref:Hsp20/alpha crystallin family protein n=1 Tax=Paenibacillus sp. YYML68 TaxID=2909250 RepID=UPI002492EF07|nr:Hsp20/alpha crystallin family protein [Paenibacillus sp. YYML68]